MANNEIKIRLYSKTVNTTVGGRKRSFPTFYTKMNLVVAGEEEKGKQVKFVTVKFRKEIDTSKLKYGILVTTSEDIAVPYKYKVEEEVIDGKPTGKKLYPVVWIRKFKEFIEQTPPKREITQNDFVEDEKDTASVEFDNSESDDEKLPF